MRRRTRTHDFFSRKKSVIVISAESILPHPSSFFSAASPEPVQSTRQTPTHPPESLSGLQLQTCAHLQQQQQHQQHHPLHPQKRLHRRRQQHHRAFLWWVSSQNLRKSSTFWILKMEERKRKTETKTDSRFFSILAKKSENVSPPSSWNENRDALVPVESEDDVTRLFVQFLLLVID